MKKKNRVTDVELDITAFMNLMVVLIPFLLIDAVFTQMSVLQLNLPAGESSSPAPEQRKPFVLEVLIYKGRFEVVDRQSESVLRVIPNQGEKHDFVALHDMLKDLKQRAKDIGQDVKDITILCEDDTPYELLITTMDTVRIMEVDVNGNMIKRELFPDIGIGSAPPDASGDAEPAAGGAA
ncbi:MAG: ExbD/TolR family protein [Pseudomonadota bacterium]